MTPWSLWAETIFWFFEILSLFRSPHLTLDIRSWSRGSPFVMRSRRAGLPYGIQVQKQGDSLSMYVSRMTLAENFLIRTFSNSKISKVFLETTFLHSLCHPDHYVYEPKIFFWFFEIHMFSIPILKSPPHPRYTILESRFPIVIRSRRAVFSYAIRVRKRGDSLSMYVSRMTRTENFLRPKFQNFSWKSLFSTVHVTLIIMHYESKIFFGT